MLKFNFITTTILLSALFVIPSCSKGTADEAKVVENLPEDIVEMRDDQIKLAGIETGAFEMHSLGSLLKVSGKVTVSPQNLATVCAPLGGFVKNASLMPGAYVSKGQTLVIIENQEFVDIQQDYLEARNKYQFAESEFKRHSELFKSDVYSEQNLQQVTSEYHSSKALVKALEQKLALIGIDPDNLQEEDISLSLPLVSPIAGYIKTVNVNLGKFVTPTDILFEIVNSDKLLLELTLYEKDADKVAEGQHMQFFINNEAEMHEAVIYQTGKSVNTDKTFTVYANVSGKCKNVLPGMYVNALVATSDSQVVALPDEAVVNFDDKDYIFIFEKNKEESGRSFCEYRMIEVKKGVSDNGYTQVVVPADLDIKTARVVVRGAYNLLSAKKNAGEMAC
jgi:membrane fusion protein, heavy metal efflux system